MRIWAVLSLAVVLSGCASGSALVTGETRAAVDPQSVKTYLEPPARFETIGIVNASSDMGWTKQNRQDYAIAELKKRAGQLGANGILIMNVGESNSGGFGTYANGMIFAGGFDKANVSAKAIYVPQN